MEAEEEEARRQQIPAKENLRKLFEEGCRGDATGVLQLWRFGYNLPKLKIKTCFFLVFGSNGVNLYYSYKL